MTESPQNQLTLFQMVETPIPIRTVDNIPRGYHALGKILRETPKGIQVMYHNLVLWLPRKAVRCLRGRNMYFAQSWAIESAKKYAGGLDK